MVLELQKEDIKKLGHTTFQEDGLTSFAFDAADEAFCIYEIFMRNILKDISPDYKILDIVGFSEKDDDEITDLVIRTNLPWDEYNKIESEYQKK